MLMVKLLQSLVAGTAKKLNIPHGFPHENYDTKQKLLPVAFNITGSVLVNSFITTGKI